MSFIDIRDSAQLTRQVQGWLRDLSRWTSDPTLSVATDGTYGSTTADAVKSFQRSNGLEPTGNTDLETWNKLSASHSALAEQYAPANGIRPFQGDFSTTVSPGERSILVYFIQIMLNELRLYYDAYGYIPLSGRYDLSTENAVKEFQSASGMENTGHIDNKTWNRMADEFILSVREGGFQ